MARFQACPFYCKSLLIARHDDNVDWRPRDDGGGVMRNLVIICGDQLDRYAAVFDEFDPAQDAVWMAEVDRENTHVWSHQQRSVLFLSAMRHFREELREREIVVHYHELQSDPRLDRGGCFSEVLKQDAKKLKPEKLQITLPGDWRVLQEFRQAAQDLDLQLEVFPDPHFYCSPEQFADWADNRNSIMLEYFYREMRKTHDVLMDGDQPVGETWNFDHENRKSFGKHGPPSIKPPHRFRHDALTEEVIRLIRDRFPDHPGNAEEFDLPVTRRQAQQMLRDFVRHGLASFGQFEDAMWTGEPFLYHSRLSAPLNLKLISPRECVEAAIAAYQDQQAPLNSVEGFIRQILGWREFVRGVYWWKMPGYESLNHFQFQSKLPQFYWDGETEMRCVRESMRSVLQHGYTHHIHRLMVLGNLSLLLGTDPSLFHQWHMAMYCDAIDWVSLPNTLGMSQFGDGGIVGTKPYISTGNYIHKMSNFCQQCSFDYREATGQNACPFTTLYWDFLDRHYDGLQDNRRMTMQLKHVDKKRQQQEFPAIRQRASEIREEFGF